MHSSLGLALTELPTWGQAGWTRSLMPTPCGSGETRSSLLTTRCSTGRRDCGELGNWTTRAINSSGEQSQASLSECHIQIVLVISNKVQLN